MAIKLTFEKESASQAVFLYLEKMHLYLVKP